MTTQIHPKAAEAQAAAAKRREERAEYAKLVAEFKRVGIRFMHLGNHVTVAYRVDRHDVVHAANTLRHPNDKHDSLFAKYLAGLRLANGQFVTLRKPPSDPFFHMTVKKLIQATFQPTAYR